MRVYPNVPGFNNLGFNNTDNGIGYDNYLSLDLNFAGTKQLDSRIQFTRTSLGTQINSNGLVEVVPYNLQTWSEGFDTNWGKLGGTTLVKNQVGFNGLPNSACLFTCLSGSVSYITNNVNVTNSSTTTRWAIVKAGTTSTIILEFVNNGAYTSSIFNITTGLIQGVTSGCSITDLGDGWKRVSKTVTAGATGTQTWAAIYFDTYGPASGNTTMTIDRVQIESGSTPNQYVKTTSVAASAPRFTHDPVTLASRGLLVEMSRANLSLWSEDFSNATWGKSESSITSNALAAPDGNLTADKLAESSATNVHNTNQTFAATSGTTYTFSVFLKKGERGFALMALIGAFTTTSIQINLTTGAVSTGTGTPLNATSQSLLNGWFRVAFSLAATSTATATALIYTSTDGVWANRTYAGDGTSGLYIWGAQIEAGAFTTSYIPTAGASATRAADSVQMTGTNFSSWYNQTEGTFVVEFIGNGGTLPRVFEVIGVTRRIILGGITADFQGDTGVATVNTNGYGTANRMAVAYTASTVVASANGGAAVSAANTSTTTATAIRIGDNSGGNRALNGTIARFRYYRRSLPAATLQTLSI